MVVGRNDNSLKIQSYDHELNLLNDISIPANKVTLRAIPRIEKLDQGYLIDVYFTHIVVDENGKQLDIKN